MVLLGPKRLTFTLPGSNRVTIGRGLQVLDVLTAFERNVIILEDVSSATSEQGLRDIGEAFGQILSVEYDPAQTEGGKLVARLTYADHSQAESAVVGLNDTEPFFTKITAKLCYPIYEGSGRLNASSVRVDIPAPGMAAYAGYETMEQAESVIEAWLRTHCDRLCIAAYVHGSHPKLGNVTVKFEGIPSGSTADNIAEELGILGGTKPLDVMIQRAEYELSARQTEDRVRRQLMERNGATSFELCREAPCNGRAHGIAKFANNEAAYAAAKVLNGSSLSCLRGGTIYANHSLRLSYKILPQILKVLHFELEKLKTYSSNAKTRFSFLYTSSGGADLQLDTFDIHDLNKIRTPLERLLAGELLTENGKQVWDRFFLTPSGLSCINTASKASQCYIRQDKIRCFIRIWGSEDARTKAKDDILGALNSVRAKNAFAIPLKGTLLHLSPNNLENIRKAIGNDDAAIDDLNQALVFRGTAEQHHLALDLFGKQGNSLSVERSSKYGDSVKAQTEICPVCRDNVTDGVVLTCGHSTCKSCLTRYISSAINHKMFPLKCIGNDDRCADLLPLRLCQQLIPTEEFMRVVEASFIKYIQMRPEEFCYCPMPDCLQLYRNMQQTSLQCPSCLAGICTSCHKVQHYGVACCNTYDEGEQLFKELCLQQDVKQCPCCSILIEKIGGCNHMMCTQCQTHICWHCLETFAQSNNVYRHMREVHGNSRW